MDHHQVERSLVFADLPFIVCMLDGKEVFIKRNVEFRGKDLLRVKSVVAPKLLQDLSCLVTSALHQGVEYFEVRGAPRSDKLVDIGCDDLVDFYPAYCGFGFPNACTVDMLANVEGFACHVPMTRLAQGRERFLYAFNLTHR